MTDIRQQIFDALALALREITTPTYQTNAGHRVFAYRDPVNRPLNQNELPCITIRETQSTGQSLTATVHRYTVVLEISGHVQDQDDTAAALRSIRADILQALGEDETLGGLVEYIAPGGEEMNTTEMGKSVGTVRMQFETRYRTPAFTPYAVHTIPE